MAHPYVDGSLVVPFPLYRLAFRIAVRHFYHLVTLNIYTTMNDNNIQNNGQLTENPMYVQEIDILDDFRTLHDVEAALLHHPDGMDEYWDDCEVDIHATLCSVRNMKRRLLAYAERVGLADGCRDIMKGGAL